MNRPATKLDLPEASEICRMSAVELAERTRARQLSVREVVTAFLDRIDAVNPKVNAIVSLRDRADLLAEVDAPMQHLQAARCPARSLACPSR